MVANLEVAQRKEGLTTLDVTLINCDYQLLWHRVMLNGEMKSNHSDMLLSPTLVVREKKDVKLDSKYRCYFSSLPAS